MAPDTRKRDWFSTEGDESENEHNSSSDDDAVVEKPRDKKSSRKQQVQSQKKSKKLKKSDSQDSDLEEESRVESAAKGALKRKHGIDNIAAFSKKSDDEDEDDQDSEQEIATDGSLDGEEENGEAEAEDELHVAGNEKGALKRLSAKELQDSRESIEKSGVIYLSRIPPYMKPAKVRQLLVRFGELGRVFLAPEDPKAYARRVRFGGNKKRNFVEGWVEFADKRKAKLAASTLNGQIIGGRKGSYYYDDILNIKYLPKFKWHHLTEQIAYENQSRQAKLRAEISQATRENKAFVRNVERAKMIEKIQSKRSMKAANDEPKSVKEPADIEIRRNFRQREVINDAEKEAAMSRVLKNIFA